MDWAPFMALLAARGDVAAEFEALRGRLYAFFVKSKRGRDDAYELVDETILEIARAATRTQIEHVMSYALVAARFRLVKRRAREVVREAKEEAVLHALYSGAPPHDEPWDDPRRAVVREAFKRLSPKRQKLLLDYFDCENRKERAQLHEWYGMPHRRVIDRVSRALCLLRKMLQSQCGAVPGEQDVP